MGIYHHSKEIEHWKHLQNSKYSIFRNNYVIIKIKFLVIMPIFILKICTSTKKESYIESYSWFSKRQFKLTPAEYGLKVKYYAWWYEKNMSPKFLLLAHVYFTDQKNTDQKYRKIVISDYISTYSPDKSYFRVFVKLLMAHLHNTDFLLG